MKYSIAFLFICLAAGFVTAQEQSLQGSVNAIKEDGTSEPIKLGVYITNINNNLVSFSNQNGEFRINAQINDTIVFQSYLYNPRKVIVNERILQDKEIHVYLTENLVELDEGTFGQVFKPYLQDEVSQDDLDKIVDQLYLDLGIDKDAEQKQNVSALNFKDINPLKIDVGRIVNAISGDTRRLRTLYQYESKQKIIQHIIAYLGNDFFANDLGIEPQHIQPLVNFAYETSQLKTLHEQASYLEIIKLLTEKSNIYKTRLQANQ